MFLVKKLILLCTTALCCLSCSESGTITVSVANSLATDRVNELVEIPMEEVTARLHLADTAQVVVLDADGQQLPYQITHDGALLFPATVAPESTSLYTVQTGVPETFDVQACGRQYPERLDDMAWENDLVGFRAYGPALQATGERGYGYDLFTKRGTTAPVLEELYAKELDPEMWKQEKELRKRDPKAADAFVNTFSYHIDHGYGMDCYAVGSTLGAGVAALMVNDTILYPWCYSEYEILDNGPLRFTVKLTFSPVSVAGDSSVVETRLISLDAGSHLNRTAVSYAGLSQPQSIVAGIVLHEPDGAVVADAENGYITYVDPTQGDDNGKLFMGIAVPGEVSEAKAVLFPDKEKPLRSGADGHLLAISAYAPETEYVYYWGFAWSLTDISTPEAWNAYMADYAEKVRHPLTVTIK